MLRFALSGGVVNLEHVVVDAGCVHGLDHLGHVPLTLPRVWVIAIAFVLVWRWRWWL